MRLSFEPIPRDPRSEEGATLAHRRSPPKPAIYRGKLAAVEEVFETKEEDARRGSVTNARSSGKVQSAQYWKDKYNKAYNLLVQSKTILENMQQKHRYVLDIQLGCDLLFSLLQRSNGGAMFRREQQRSSNQVDKLEVKVKWLRAQVDDERKKRKEAQRIAEEMLFQVAMEAEEQEPDVKAEVKVEEVPRKQAAEREPEDMPRVLDQSIAEEESAKEGMLIL